MAYEGAVAKLTHSELLDTGVYCILCTASGKRYIGSSASSIMGRWHLHRKQLRKGNHHSLHLQRAWTKYGESSFDFTVLATCAPDECITMEQKFIDAFRASERHYGYNINPNARSPLGVKFSAERIAIHRKAIRGYWDNPDPEHVRKMVEASHTPEMRLQHSQRMKGRKFSDEHKAKMREAWTRRGEITDSARVAMGAAQRKRYSDPEQRAKMSEYAKRGHAIRAAKKAASP